MIRQGRKRNTPVATLIKNYVNKKSGKVTDSRQEIQRRFDYLDWKDQKKIISAFLESGKTDRQWAYSKALNYWDESFVPRIKELWEQLHEKMCSRVVIHHFPLEYLSQNIDKFTDDGDYFFICMRTAWDKSFVIDRDRLSKTEYLAVLYHTGRTIDTAEAETLLYDVVHDICLDCDPMSALDRFTDDSKGHIFSPKSFHFVNSAYYYLQMMGHVYLTTLFDIWNEKVQEAIFYSPEFRELCVYELSDFDYRCQMIKIARKYTYMLLDDKYKKPSDPPIEEILKPKEGCSMTIDKELEMIKHHQCVKKDEPANFEPANSVAALNEMIAKNQTLGKMVGDLGLVIKHVEPEDELFPGMSDLFTSYL